MSKPAALDKVAFFQNIMIRQSLQAACTVCCRMCRASGGRALPAAPSPCRWALPRCRSHRQPRSSCRRGRRATVGSCELDHCVRGPCSRMTWPATRWRHTRRPAPCLEPPGCALISSRCAFSPPLGDDMGLRARSVGVLFLLRRLAAQRLAFFNLVRSASLNGHFLFARPCASVHSRARCLPCSCPAACS